MTNFIFFLIRYGKTILNFYTSENFFGKLAVQYNQTFKKFFFFFLKFKNKILFNVHV